jgi:hypothetical protein
VSRPDCLLLEENAGATADAFGQRADALYRSRRALGQALTFYEKAVKAGADPLRVARDQWMCAMLIGDFAAAWRIADRVMAERQRRRMSCAQLPYHQRWVWEGEPLDGRRILVRCYHGLGDSIQFLRLAARLRRRVRHIAVQAVPELVPLIERMEGVDDVVPFEVGRDPPHDLDIEASELLHALRIVPDAIPRHVPYIAIDPGRVAQRRRDLGAPERLKVGIVWTAGAWRPERSVPLARLRPIWAVDGVKFVSLQRGPGAAELDRLPDAPLAQWGNGTVDLLATAEAMTALDLVITVDTMAAHLAGALGIPVWTFLLWQSDWRWMLRGNKTPWYPTMRLFRQRSPGDWDSVVARVAAALRQQTRADGQAGSLQPSTIC